jgi:hypothetical protein
VVGNGFNMLFWSDPWLNGQILANLMPQLVEVVPVRIQRRRTVASVMHHSAWIHDIKGSLTIPMLVQYLHLRQQLQDFTLTAEADCVLWR